MRPPRGYKILEHTADFALQAWGENLEEVFEEVARGIFEYVSVPSLVRPVGEIHLRTEALDLRFLLKRWLEELLFYHSTRSFVYSSFKVHIERVGGEFHLWGRAEGESYNPSFHGPLHEIKAVTLHSLEVQESPPQATVVVDI